MAALMSERAPSNSSDTMPISSVTLAWRTFVITANRCVNSQITGFVISFGGYISQSRVFCGALTESRAGELFVRGCFGRRVLEVATGFPFQFVKLTACDCRNNTDFVSIF